MPLLKAWFCIKCLLTLYNPLIGKKFIKYSNRGEMRYRYIFYSTFFSVRKENIQIYKYKDSFFTKSNKFIQFTSFCFSSLLFCWTIIPTSNRNTKYENFLRLIFPSVRRNFYHQIFRVLNNFILRSFLFCKFYIIVKYWMKLTLQCDVLILVVILLLN